VGVKYAHMGKSISHLFGSEAKVKIMRLFVFNKGAIFTMKTIGDRVQVGPKVVRKELSSLMKAGLIHKRARGYILNNEYDYLKAVERFLVEASPVTEKEIIRRLSKAGTMRLILTSGVFKQDSEARVDLLVVGDKIKEGVLLRAIGTLEAELGKELRYAAFETPDFKYRLGIYDKLVRDILDYPHRKLVDKVGIQSGV
jgi:hypothetical protein